MVTLRIFCFSHVKVIITLVHSGLTEVLFIPKMYRPHRFMKHQRFPNSILYSIYISCLGNFKIKDLLFLFLDMKNCPVSLGIFKHTKLNIFLVPLTSLLGVLLNCHVFKMRAHSAIDAKETLVQNVKAALHRVHFWKVDLVLFSPKKLPIYISILCSNGCNYHNAVSRPMTL